MRPALRRGGIRRIRTRASGSASTATATALSPTRRLFFSNAAGAACGVVAGAACGVALPALADSGVPMDLGPLGLRNGGSGKLNSCPPQGIKRACIGTSKFDT